jgi:hypothetical protein
LDRSDVERRFEQLAARGATIASDTFAGTNTGTGVDSQNAHQWATSVSTLVRAAFGSNSSQSAAFEKCFSAFHGYAFEFKNALGVFLGLRDDFKSGFTTTYRRLVENDLNEEVLDQAESLLEAGYTGPACVVAGVAMEVHVKQMISDRGLPLGKLDQMNADLAKAGAYNVSMQKQVIAWTGRRNDAAHGHWERFTHEDVDDMIRGVRRFLAET